jgi:hypothetical protein
VGDDRYDFEAPSSGATQRSDEAEFEEIFLERLGLESLAPLELAPVRAFVREVHVNIEWYNQRLVREKRLRIGFTLISIGLLAVIPVAVLFLSKLFQDASALTAGLTGLLGVHRSFSAWMDKRRLVGHFWAAQSDLKELLYDVESRWQDHRADGGNADARLAEVLVDLDASVDRAREIVRAERKAFYELWSPPPIQIANVLRSARKDASGLVDDFAPELRAKEKHAADLRAAEDAVVRANSLDRYFAGLLDSEKRELKSRKDEDHDRAISRINGLERERAAAKRKRGEAQANLAVLKERSE